MKLPIPGVTGVRPVQTFSLGKILSSMRIGAGTPGFGGGAIKGQSFGKAPFKNPAAVIKSWADFKNMHFAKKTMKGGKF